MKNITHQSSESLIREDIIEKILNNIGNDIIVNFEKLISIDVLRQELDDLSNRSIFGTSKFDLEQINDYKFVLRRINDENYNGVKMPVFKPDRPLDFSLGQRENAYKGLL